MILYDPPRPAARRTATPEQRAANRREVEAVVENMRRREQWKNSRLNRAIDAVTKPLGAVLGVGLFTVLSVVLLIIVPAVAIYGLWWVGRWLVHLF